MNVKCIFSKLFQLHPDLSERNQTDQSGNRKVYPWNESKCIYHSEIHYGYWSRMGCWHSVWNRRYNRIPFIRCLPNMLILVTSYPKITVFQKQAILICIIISEKLQTVSGGMFLNMLNSIPENMLKLPDISTKEHSHLHLVNSYDSFLVFWSKTNWMPN